MEKRNYWCYRINKDLRDFFKRELVEGRLRQGWGWDPLQNLRDIKIDEGARRNLAMYNNVKKGDILLIPHLTEWNEVAIIEATSDWNTGYRFEISETYGDYGHIFPAKLTGKSFKRNNQFVTGNLRATLKNPSRFWNINHYAKDVEKLLETDKGALHDTMDYSSRFDNSIGSTFNDLFNEKLFGEKLYEKISNEFRREEWEFALQYGLQELFPYYDLLRVGGPEEKNHGTDILIKIPGIIPDIIYGIAVQVKDYKDFVNEDVINQINKADMYWENEGVKLIDKVVIITRGEREINTLLSQNISGVKIIYASDLKELLVKIAKSFISTKQFSV